MNRIVCAIDTESTGLDPATDHLIELAIVPLNSGFRPDTSRKPFEVLINPGIDVIRSIPIGSRAMEINGISRERILRTGLDRIGLISKLYHWMHENRIGQVSPLAQNWGHDRGFLKALIGELFDIFFHYHARDTMTTAQYLNDVRVAMGTEPLFKKSVSLVNLARVLGVKLDNAHRATDDAKATAAVYREMIQHVRRA